MHAYAMQTSEHAYFKSTRFSVAEELAQSVQYVTCKQEHASSICRVMLKTNKQSKIRGMTQGACNPRAREAEAERSLRLSSQPVQLTW